MPRPVLLALSSFRDTDAEIEHALRRCEETSAPLVTVFVVDINLARYFAHSGVMAGTSLREQMEHGILDDQKRKAQDELERVCALTAERGIECETILRVGRFAEEVEAVAREENAGLIIVTRARRPRWLRRLFGSPLNRVCDDLGDTHDIDIVERARDE